MEDWPIDVGRENEKNVFWGWIRKTEFQIERKRFYLQIWCIESVRRLVDKKSSGHMILHFCFSQPGC